MRAIIPHHSILILTSEGARIKDPCVRKLAASIIEAQKRKIAEMKAQIIDLQGGPKRYRRLTASNRGELTSRVCD